MTCKSCDTEIEAKRLRAKPDATLCIECASEAERSGRFVRHRMDVQPVTKCGEMDELTQTIVRGA